MTDRPDPKILPEERTKLLTALLAADRKKAQRIAVYDITERQTFTDYLIVCHGSSDRQVQAIYEGIDAALRPLKIRPIGVEGQSLAYWILMDYGGVVVHIFYEPYRDFYDIDGLWASSPALDVPALIALAEAEENAPASPAAKSDA